MHDACVFRNSPFCNEVCWNYFFQGNSHLVADFAYPLLKWVLTPLKNHGNLTRQQGRYNFKQSSKRMAVKGQFRRSKLNLDVYIIEDASMLVMAARI